MVASLVPDYLTMPLPDFSFQLNEILLILIQKLFVGQKCLRNIVLWDYLLLQSERITSVGFYYIEGFNELRDQLNYLSGSMNIEINYHFRLSA